MPKDEPKVSEPEAPPALKGSDKTKFDELVKAKVAAGLPRPDAEEVARRQIEADKASK